MEHPVKDGLALHVEHIVGIGVASEVVAHGLLGLLLSGAPREFTPKARW